MTPSVKVCVEAGTAEPSRQRGKIVAGFEVNDEGIRFGAVEDASLHPGILSEWLDGFGRDVELGVVSGNEGHGRA